MKLKFIDANDQVAILAAGDSIQSLKEIACAHYTGDEILIWREGVENNHVEEESDSAFCSDKLSNGTYYCIE